VDFLEKNSDFSICFHKVKLNISEQIKKDTITHVPKKVSSAIDLARYGNYIHTCSCVFRNRKQIYNEIPRNISPGDYAVHLFNSKNGEKIGYINKNMAVYRVHSGGVFRGAKKEENVKNELQFYARLMDCFQETISSLLLYRFFLVFTNTFLTLPDQTQKDKFLEFALGLLQDFDKKTLLSIVLFKTELESNKYIGHILKTKIVRRIKRFYSSNE
jgi:hypothetical protein